MSLHHLLKNLAGLLTPEQKPQKPLSDVEGHRDVLGHWVGTGGEGANFWLSVVTDLQPRGVKDIFIACIDGLTGFREAIQAIFPHTYIQRCVIHQVRHSRKYVNWRNRKAFAADMRSMYQAATREEAQTHLLLFSEKWGRTYGRAVKSWENNWEDLSTFFDSPQEIRQLVYTTNSVESYHRQLRKVVKTKGAFPSAEAVRKLLYLANRDITGKWIMPMHNWATILNQLAIRFEGRFQP
jgi:putative transposase